VEVLCTQKRITCNNAYHEPPQLENGYFEFKADDSQFKFWMFISPQEKAKIMKDYFDNGKCLLCSIDELLMA
jgi:hypothetical protein